MYQTEEMPVQGKPEALTVSQNINEVWFMDFTIRLLNVLDDYNKQELGIEVDVVNMIKDFMAGKKLVEQIAVADKEQLFNTEIPLKPLIK